MRGTRTLWLVPDGHRLRDAIASFVSGAGDGRVDRVLDCRCPPAFAPVVMFPQVRPYRRAGFVWPQASATQLTSATNV